MEMDENALKEFYRVWNEVEQCNDTRGEKVNHVKRELEHVFSGIGPVKKIDVIKAKKEAQIIHPLRGPGRRVDEKESALQVAQSQVEAFQMELEVQRDVAVKKQQQDDTTI
ncbi:hypothetical protein PsorP6_017434 [Peronosclerospora sorghi]|uniref:Uncharacterized protein n=1 Tax=Peronosclerospora sorghi TaxID=230839 RepID=A0ACC0WMB6_9STRA|nr:hypothetical protein PsorP6_017434 [Peronosclerospora sorghi]